MEWWKALILGLVQGFTEFLPVSSSGHLVLVQSWLGVESNNTVFFAVMLHVATLVSVCAVLYKEIWALLKKPFSKPVYCLVLATIPAGIVGLALNDFFDTMFEGTKWLWIFFLMSACILLASDIIGNWYEKKGLTRTPKMDTVKEDGTTVPAPLFSTIGYDTTLIMGLCQAFAIFPGVTRSGSTIAGGVAGKAKRSEVARFSFLMSIPIILSSALLEGIGMAVDHVVIDIPWYSIVIGMVAALISGYVAVKWMLRLVEKCQLKWFSLYLVLMSIFVIVNNFVGIW